MCLFISRDSRSGAFISENVLQPIRRPDTSDFGSVGGLVSRRPGLSPVPSVGRHAQKLCLHQRLERRLAGRSAQAAQPLNLFRRQSHVRHFQELCANSLQYLFLGKCAHRHSSRQGLSLIYSERKTMECFPERWRRRDVAVGVNGASESLGSTHSRKSNLNE